MMNRATVLATSVAAMVGLTAVSGGSRAASMDPKLHAMLPADIQKSGEVRVGTEPTAPPTCSMARTTRPWSAWK